MKKFLLIGALLFTFLATTGMSCNVVTGDVPEVSSCDIGVVGCTASSQKRTCKFDLPNLHYHGDHFPLRGQLLAWTAFVYTDWCYKNGIITSRHSDPQEAIEHDAALAGFYFTSRYWWSSDCYPSTNPTECLTRREVAAYNPFTERIETVCIGTRIYGWAGGGNHNRNITEHGCPGDSRLLRSGSRSTVADKVRITDELKDRALAGFRLLSREDRRRVRAACAGEAEGVGGVLSSGCGRALGAAFQSLDQADRAKVINLAARASNPTAR